MFKTSFLLQFSLILIYNMYLYIIYSVLCKHFYFRDCSRCLKYLAFRGRHNQFLFIGDSRILDIYNAFIHTIEPKTQLVQSSTFSYSHFVDKDHQFHDSRLKLDVNFVWSPSVLDPMVDVFKKLKASKLNIYKLTKKFYST